MIPARPYPCDPFMDTALDVFLAVMAVLVAIAIVSIEIRRLKR